MKNFTNEIRFNLFILDDDRLLVIYKNGSMELPKATTKTNESLEDCIKREGIEKFGIDILTWEIIDKYNSSPNNQKISEYDILVTDYEGEIKLNPIDYTDACFFLEEQLYRVPLSPSSKEIINNFYRPKFTTRVRQTIVRKYINKKQGEL